MVVGLRFPPQTQAKYNWVSTSPYCPIVEVSFAVSNEQGKPLDEMDGVHDVVNDDGVKAFMFPKPFLKFLKVVT